MKLGERRSLRILALRWVGIIVALCVVGGFGADRYDRDVVALFPEQLLMQRSDPAVRVLGRVQAGTFTSVADGGRFELSGESNTALVVRYFGPPDENVRELKVIVVEGEWDSERRELIARKFRLLPNYGFVTAAYLFSLLPLGFFLFRMERKVILLSLQIKETP